MSIDVFGVKRYDGLEFGNRKIGPFLLEVALGLASVSLYLLLIVGGGLGKTRSGAQTNGRR
ncbi:MAG: hypothetical protein WA419_02145 [Silvibacterium sp.]